MKVLMVGPSKDSLGGISTVIRNIYVAKRDYEVFLMNNWQEDRRNKLFLKNFFKIRKEIKREKIDIVHFHVAQNGSFYRKALLLLHTPKSVKTVFHMHASKFDEFYEESNPIEKFFIKSILNEADLIVAVSESWKNYYETITDTKVIAMNNAVRTSNTNSYNPHSKNVITLGRLGTRKGSYDIIKVAERVYKERPDITFYLYGDGEVEKLEKETENMPNVCIRKWLDDEGKEQQFRDTALHFLPSYHEGLPMSILETMSAGIPNLSTDVGGIPTVIKEGVNGYLTKPGQIEEMAEIILCYMNLDDTEKTRISQKAMETIGENFSLDRYVEEWSTVYESLLTVSSNVSQGESTIK